MCLLGEQCPFDHGNDPLVITGMPPYPPPPPPPPFPLSLPPHPPPHHHLTKTNAGQCKVLTKWVESSCTLHFVSLCCVRSLS